jgi:hypothetical protein
VQLARPSIIILDEDDDNYISPPSFDAAASSDALNGHQPLDAANEQLYTYTKSTNIDPLESYCRASDSWISRIFGLLDVVLHLRLHLGVQASNLLTVMKAIVRPPHNPRFYAHYDTNNNETLRSQG